MEKSKYRQKQKFDFTPYEGQSDAQLLDTGKHWVDSNNFYNLQTCFDLITALRDKQKSSVAVELSRYLFEKVPSARNLNAWMVSVIDEGYIDKQIDMLNQIEDKLKICNVEFDRNIFATWLKTINYLIDIGKIDKSEFFEVYNKCPDEEKYSNTYIIAQHYVRLNADGRYKEVIAHYNTLPHGVKNNFFVKRYYENALELSGGPRPIENENKKDNKGLFIVFGRNIKQYDIVKQLLETSDAHILSLKEIGTEGSKTITEQIDGHIHEASHAIVLLSADDIGYLASDAPVAEANRARENVIFEYGYVVGALGRDNVVSLSSDTALQLPSDIIGIRFIQFDIDNPRAGINDLVSQLKKWNFTFNDSKLVQLLLSL